MVFSTTIYSYFFFSIYLSSALFNKLLHNWIHISFAFLILGLFILFNPDASQILFIYNLMDVLNIIF
ncbi:hypothetical protein bthur0004_64270 [Bacillus thuringiensis serovar sotto str. T04001]|nr:hypothetical protein bthur0004_64270 [Bacillus thuringiensis serovar sotto str. T04001]